MTTQILLRIDAEKRRTLNRLSKAEGKTVSGVVRELIDGFLKSRDMGAYIDDLWTRTGKKLKKSGFAESDIERVIAESRKART